MFVNLSHFTLSESEVLAAVKWVQSIHVICWLCKLFYWLPPRNLMQSTTVKFSVDWSAPATGLHGQTTASQTLVPPSLPCYGESEDCIRLLLWIAPDCYYGLHQIAIMNEWPFIWMVSIQIKGPQKLSFAFHFGVFSKIVISDGKYFFIQYTTLLLLLLLRRLPI